MAKAATDDLTGADETIAEAQDLVDEKSLTVYRAHVGLAAGELLWRRRELDRAEETLAAAYQTAMEAGQRLMAAWILRARSRLAREAGREGEARAHAEAVLSAVETMCGSMADETLRESFRAKWLQDVGKPSTEALP